MTCCRCLEPPLLADNIQAPTVEAQYNKNNRLYRTANAFIAFSLILGISAVSSSCIFYESGDQDTVTKVMAITGTGLVLLASLPLFIARRQGFNYPTLRNRFICQLITCGSLGSLAIALSTASFFYHRESCPVFLGN